MALENYPAGPSTGIAGCFVRQRDDGSVHLTVPTDDVIADAILSPEEAICLAYVLLAAAMDVWAPAEQIQRSG